MHPALGRSLETCWFIGEGYGVHCRDMVTIEDFKPRKFSLSFGFECLRRSLFSNLKGLNYSASISGLTNKNYCTSNWLKNSTAVNHFGYRDFKFVTNTNLLGNNLSYSEYNLKYLKAYRYRTNCNPICYKHFIEIAYYILSPDCHPDTGQVVHPCKEACYDMIGMCKDDQDMNMIFGDSWEFDCDYLPSVWDETACFHRPVECNPLIVNHGMRHNYTNFYLYQEVKYVCKSGYKLLGKNIITCMNND